jgi:hypothetical protein
MQVVDNRLTHALKCYLMRLFAWLEYLSHDRLGESICLLPCLGPQRPCLPDERGQFLDAGDDAALFGEGGGGEFLSPRNVLAGFDSSRLCHATLHRIAPTSPASS